MTSSMFGPIAFGAVVLLVVVYTLVEWLRSRGRPSKGDKEEEGGGGHASGPGAPHGGDGGGDSGGDGAPS